MHVVTDFDLDDTGKIDLNGIYDKSDPRAYYQTLRKLDYRIPAAAEPSFRKVISTLRTTRQTEDLSVLDVGCSYGVNAAILAHGRDLSEMFDHYGDPDVSRISRRDLISRDRLTFRHADPNLKVVGLDTAANAVAYACDAGIMDGGVVADFESRSPTQDEAKLIADVDLVISTGAIGYVGAPTFTRILDAAEEGPPWFALLALRMFPIDDIAEVLKARGYAVFRQERQTYRQRRFASLEERTNVLTNLDDMNIDPAGKEAEGWYHAEFFFARPDSEAAPDPVRDLVAI